MGRSHALAIGALAVALGAAADLRLAFAVGIATTAGVALLPSRFRPGRARSVALVIGAWLIVLRVGIGSAGPAGGAGGPNAVASDGPWTGEIRSVTKRAGGKQAALVAIPGEGLVYAKLPRFPEFVPGDRVALEGRLEPLADPADPNPADLDPANPAQANPARANPDQASSDNAGWVAYLGRIGAAASLDARSARLVGRTDDPAATLERVRSGAGDALLTALPEPQGGLAAGILIGLRERVDPSLVRDFTAAGLTHVIAISGWNIAIVAAVCGALVRPLARRRRALVIGAVIAAYTIFAGASPSVVRAALMAGVALISRESGQRAGASRALALAVVLMLIVDPAAATDPGFQLSACATAGLVAWASTVAARLERIAPRLPATVRETLAVSLTAQLATLPAVLLDFGRLSLISPVANLAAAPLVPLVMAGAAAALPLGLLAGFAPSALLAIPLVFVSLPIGLLIGIAHLAASVPFASLQLPTSVAIPAAACAALLVAFVARNQRGRPVMARAVARSGT